MEARQAFDQGLVGARVDKYQVVEEVGYGGMSVVYRALDEVLDREVAVKVLHTHLSKRTEARRRFHREARAVAKLQHPNIVEIYDFSGEDSSYSYIVTEFIRGPTLREFIDGRGVAFPEIGAMIAIQVGEALAHAHELGVVHRDIKPENVMIRSDGMIKLMDFGIAQLRDAQKMTETGSLLGSPAHMAPEVVSGEEPDTRSDIFSLGTVIYYVTTGALPFSGRNAAVVLRSIVEGKYVDPEMQDPKIGQALGGIIKKCLARDPDRRFQSVEEAVAALRECTEEVGLVDPVSELRQYFAAPDTYERAIRGQLVAALERCGREALERREVARAVDAFNRVLAINDRHEGVRKLLARLDRRRRWAGYGIAFASLLAVTAVVLLTTGVFSSQGSGLSEDELAQAGEVAQIMGDERAGEVSLEAEDVASGMWIDEVRRERIEPATVVARQVAAPFQARRAAQARATALEARGRAVAEALAREDRDRERVVRREALGAPDPIGDLEPPPTPDPELVAREVEDERVLVRLRPYPRIVMFSVDGTRYGDLGEYAGGILLSPGTHRIEYTHPLVQSATQIIRVPRAGDLPAGEEAFAAEPFSVQWQDALLMVESDIAAVVLVDGQPVGESGEVIHLPIDDALDSRDGRRDGRISVDITVLPATGSGRPVAFDNEEFGANQRRTFEARFRGD